MRLPPPQATVVVKNGEAPGSDLTNKNPLQGMNTLTISVLADPSRARSPACASAKRRLRASPPSTAELKELFRDQGNPFDQVIIQVSDSCRYDELMKIIDVCTHQTLSDGKKLSKLSFVELPGG